MPKHAGAYRGDKRRKEITRQKKQEEKRVRRLNKSKDTGPHETEETGAENTDTDIALTEKNLQESEDEQS